MSFNMNTDTKLPYLPNYPDSLDFNAILRVALTDPCGDATEAALLYEQTITQESH